MPSAPEFECRRARPDEREALLDCIQAAFDEPPGYFAREMPQLFEPSRMGDHWIAASHSGRILGVVGCYPFPFRFGNQEHACFGIGQVSTREEARGRGIFSALMERALADLPAESFQWLYGDRRRYGHFGFKSAGTAYVFKTHTRYLKPWASTAEPKLFDPAEEVGYVQELLKQQPQALVMSDAELAMCCRGRGIRGLRIGESAVLFDGNRALLASGSAHEILPMLTWQASNAPEHGGWLDILTGPQHTPLREAAEQCYQSFAATPAAQLRNAQGLFKSENGNWPTPHPLFYMPRLFDL